MRHFIVLSKLAPECLRDEQRYSTIAHEILGRLQRELDWFRWHSSYLTLGRSDVVDIVEVPDATDLRAIQKIFRTDGREALDVLLATLWKGFTEQVQRH